MILYPSIHIKDGMVGRLTRSAKDIAQADILNTPPHERAMEFEQQGFPWIHVVDLNGAFEGFPVNVEAIDSILQHTNIPLQLSGGMRNMKVIESWLMKGVGRVVLTSAALQDPDLVYQACRAFPGRVAVKVDSRNGYVAATGWTRSSSMKALDLALRVEDAGVAALIYADINRDGALGEVNIEAIIDLAFSLTTPVIASGGVNSMQDLLDLKSHAKTGIAGLILGGALYNGKIIPGEALALASAASVAA